jgi:hypothetical protein
MPEGLARFVHRQRPRGESRPSVDLDDRPAIASRAAHQPLTEDQPAHAKPVGRRWSPRSTLLLGLGVSLLLWIGLAWAIAAFR